MAQDKSSKSAMVQGAGDTFEVMPATATSAAAPVRPRMASGDPDRVVASFDLGGIPMDPTARDAQRGAGAGIKAEFRAMIKAQLHARALADGLCSLGEIGELSERVLNAKIAARKMGILSRVEPLSD